MKIYAISDVHVDYAENRKWLFNLSSTDYTDDVLIIAGDLSDDLQQLKECIASIQKKFKMFFYVPGNHELWIRNKDDAENSLSKFATVCDIAVNEGAIIKPVDIGKVTIVPMLSWYDFSFAEPSEKILTLWSDFRMCQWPNNMEVADVSRYFHNRNSEHLDLKNETIISFSHFLPRIDLMPSFIPQQYRYVYPVLGSADLEKQIRQLSSSIHIYGHSHVNRHVEIDSITYINNAYGYPTESNICRKQLVEVHMTN